MHMQTSQNQVEPTKKIANIEMKGYYTFISLPSEGLITRRFKDDEILITRVTKEFATLPQRFISQFKRIRFMVYQDILPYYTFKISVTHTKNMYFLPLAKTEDFLQEMEGVKDLFRVLQTEIDEFINSRDSEMQRINEYSRLKRVTRLTRCPDLVSSVAVTILQVHLSKEAFEGFLDEEELRDLKLTRAKMRLQQEQMIKQSVADIETRMGKLIQDLTETIISTSKYKEVKAEQTAEKLNELKKLCESANLDHIWGSGFRVALDLAEAVKAEDKEAFEKASQSLAEELGYTPEGEKSKTSLVQIAQDLKKDGLSSRAKMLLDTVL